MEPCGWSRFSFPTAGACLSRQLSLDQLIMMAYLWCLIVMIYRVNKYICEDSICSVGMKRCRFSSVVVVFCFVCLFQRKKGHAKNVSVLIGQGGNIKMKINIKLTDQWLGMSPAMKHRWCHKLKKKRWIHIDIFSN